MIRISLFGFIVVGLLMTLPSTILAAGFRIETKVFAGKEKEPVAENLTVFSDGVAYDFSLLAPREVAILDTARLKFTLLDPAREVQTTIDCKDLQKFAADLQAVARGSENVSPVHKFAADPRYTEHFERTVNGNGVLTLSSGVIDYRVEAIRPPQDEAAQLYAVFADWYARLNTTKPGELPPFYRLHLNAVLGKHGVVPTRVERTIIVSPGQKHVAWSEHLVGWQLTGKDRQQIDQSSGYQAKFKSISFADYRALSQAATEVEKK